MNRSPESRTSAAVSVALVEDNDGLRESLSVLLDSTPGFRCVGAFRSGEAALRGLPAAAPDVVLMDINLPRMSGVACVRQLTDLMPAVRILMLTVFAEREHIFDALKAGAHGYLSKRTAPAELLKAILEVRSGGAPMSSEVAARVVEYFHRQDNVPAPETVLSAREREILELLARGYLYKEIAADLGLAYDTVHWHLRKIYEKLHVRSRGEAVAKVYRRS
jgi:DNA-binding NarL/FixJ family response regulator